HTYTPIDTPHFFDLPTTARTMKVDLTHARINRAQECDQFHCVQCQLLVGGRYFISGLFSTEFDWLRPVMCYSTVMHRDMCRRS
ncbi:MAG: hypothetical protein JWM69_1093, partial [Candidatus Binatus sp.]|nr:hypothetical protein [Candidatus Binatus sp.]